MFDDVKDRIARLSVARLQKRIDALKAQQEMLDKFTAQRGLNELEHYRMQMSIGVASMVFFLVLIVFGTCMALMVKMHTNTQFELILSALILLMFFIIIGGIWDSHCNKAVKYWQAASPINRAELQRRIDDPERALTQSMAKRFGWNA